MDYELIKQLKNAGWNFSEKYDCKIFVIEGEFDSMGNNKIFRMPTVSELIEACGDCLSHIKRLPVGDKEYWLAVSHCGHAEHQSGGNNLEEQGSTIEEAVARLFIALQEKK